MNTKIIHFIKYNNATVIIILFIFLFGASVFASEDVRSAIISEESIIEGVDNSLLLSADIDKIDMDFKINKIEEDSEFYYATYTYIDLVEENNTWQYLMKEKTRKISKRIKKDLAVFLGEELAEEYEQRKKELTIEKKKAEVNGEEKRVEVVKYSGIIGQALDVSSRIFPGYSSVKRNLMPSPDFSPVPVVSQNTNQVDEIMTVYDDYINSHLEEIAILDSAVSSSTATSTVDIATTTVTIIEETLAEPQIISYSTEDIIIEEPVVVDVVATEDIIMPPSATTSAEDIIQ